jgi:hypothetical protein
VAPPRQVAKCSVSLLDRTVPSVTRRRPVTAGSAKVVLLLADLAKLGEEAIHGRR